MIRITSKNVENRYGINYFKRMWKIDIRITSKECGKLIWYELLQKNVEDWYKNYFERMWKIDMIWITSKECGKLMIRITSK